MECGDCGIRSSVGYCHECEMLLCEECSHTCGRCKKTVCRSHIQRTSSGRRICVSCVVHHYDRRARKAKERREMRAEAVADGGRAPKKRRKQTRPEMAAEATENLSFEALQLDQGGISAGPSVPDEEREPLSPLDDHAALNSRVLTGSASQGPPAWVRGLMLAAGAWLLFFGAFTGAPPSLPQHIFNALAVLFSFVAMLYTFGHAFAKEIEPTVKKRSRAVLALGAGAFALSGLVLFLRLTA